MWVYFSDNHSDGKKKLAQTHIFIEASLEQAKVVFYGRTGVNPDRQSCYCCDQDYDAEEFETLEKATAWSRGCVYNKETGEFEDRFAWNGVGGYETIEEFVLRDDVLIVRSDEIDPDEALIELPEEDDDLDFEDPDYYSEDKDPEDEDSGELDW